MPLPGVLVPADEPQAAAKPASRVFVACSGLGRIRRGNETWARSVAEGLHRAGGRVTLLGGGPLRPQCPYRSIANIPREFKLTRALLPWRHRYLLEQLSAAAGLLVRPPWQAGDILHVADPDLAWQMHKRARVSGLRVIYKDGLLLGPAFSRRFDYVQVLAPYYLDLARKEGVDTKNWFVIPHLVDTAMFAPDNDRAAARKALPGRALDPDAFVVLAAGDFSKEGNKRLDWIVNEFSMLSPEIPAQLVAVGQASDRELASFERRARTILGGRVQVFANLRTDEMALLYRASDAFAHAALREPFGIVFLEAMACGLPVVAHRFPVTEWIIGDGGRAIDMTEPGALAGTLQSWIRDGAVPRAIGLRARRRVVETFAEERIVPLYQHMYEQIAAEPLPTA